MSDDNGTRKSVKRSLIRRTTGWIDLSDVLTFGGLGMLGYGISLFSVPIALITVGAALFLLGIWLVMPRIPRKSEKQ